MYRGLRLKSDIFGPERGMYLGLPGKEICQMIDDQWNAMKRGIEIIYPSSISMKSENLKPDKLHKKRVIHVVDPVTVVNQRRLYQPLQHAFDTLGMQSPFILRADPLVDWHQLVSQIQKHPYHLATDVSSFDLTVPSYILEAAATFCCAVTGSTAAYATMLKTMGRINATTPLLVENVVLAKEGALCSGIWGTSFKAGACQYIIVYVVVREVIGPLCTPEWYVQNVTVKVCGDDLVISWSRRAHNLGFRADYLRTKTKELFGMCYTSTLKEEGELECIPLKDLSFCSRTFVHLPGHPQLWTGRLKIEAMSSSLCWTKLTNESELINHLDAFAREFAAWDDSYYSKFIALRQTVLPSLAVKTLKTLRQELHDQILFAIDAKFIKQEDTEFKYTLKMTDTLPKAKAIPFNEDPATFQVYKLEDKTMSPMTTATLFRRLRDAFLNAQTIDDFIQEPIFKIVRDLNYPEVFVTQTLNRDGNIIQLVSPQPFSPTSWVEIVKFLSTQRGVLPSWIPVVFKYHPYGTSNKERAFQSRYTIGMAIADFLLRGRMDAYKAILRENNNVGDAATKVTGSVQDSETDIPASVTPKIAAIERVLRTEKCPEETARLMHPSMYSGIKNWYRRVPFTHSSIKDPHVFHTHLCSNCDQEYGHSHAHGVNEKTHSLCNACLAKFASDQSKFAVNEKVMKTIKSKNGENIVRIIKKYKVQNAATSPLVPYDVGDESAADGPGPATTSHVSNTGGFVTGQDATAGSASAQAGAVVGLTNDPLPAITTGNPALSMGMMAGEALTSALIVAPGVVGQELVHQTGYGQNLLTLAGKKMFLRTINVNVGTGAGVILFNEEINPWNKRILNKYAQVWADQHARFYGNLRLHFEMITCATIIAMFRVYMIPQAMADTTPLTLEALDAFPYMSLTGNSTGENFIDLNPTITHNAQTGIWRNSAKNFGRIVIATACKIQNTTAENIQIQLRVLASLPEGCIYDIPYDLITPQIPENVGGNSMLDIGIIGTDVLLSSDGYHVDTLRWLETPTISDDWLPTTLVRGALMCYPYSDVGVFPGWMVSGNKAFPYGTFGRDSKLHAIFALDGNKHSGVNYTADTAPSLNDGSYGKHMQTVREAMHKRMPTGNETINYQNVQLNQVTTVFAGKVGGGNFFMWKNNVTRMMIKEGRGLAYNYDKSLTCVDNTYYIENYVKSGGIITSDAWVFSAWAESPYAIEITGVPICTNSNTTTQTCPPSYFAVRLSDSTSILPAVAPGIKGNTMCASFSHTVSMLTTSRLLNASGNKSIITTINGEAGKYLCTVLRNNHGTFINKLNLPEYSTMSVGLRNSHQTHEFSTQVWPQIQASDPSIFKTRSISSRDSVVFGGVGDKRKEQVVSISRNDFLEMYNTQDESCAGVVAGGAGVARAAGAAGGAGAPGVASMATSAGIGQAAGGFFGFLGNIVDAIAAPSIAEAKTKAELKTWKERNAIEYSQRQQILSQTMNQRALGLGGTFGVGNNF